MDIQQYISSGVIEAYVLGMASAEEVRTLQLLRRQYPEVEAALLAAEAGVEQYTRLQAIEPPAGAKEQIWAALQEADKVAAIDTPGKNGTDIAGFGTPERKARPVLPIMLIAATIVTFISIGLSLLFWKKTESMEEAMLLLRKEQRQTADSFKASQQQLERINSMLLDPAMKSVFLAGVGGHAAGNAVLFWDSHSKTVYLSLRNMPPPPAGKQYKLWAIVDGKPVDAGLYAVDDNTGLQKMKIISKAQMFAVTIEDLGGSAAPTLDQMVASGKV